MKKPTEQLLTELEARRKRWHSKFKRAANELFRIEEQRKRLLRLAARPLLAKSFAETPKPKQGEPMAPERMALYEKLADALEEELKIPNFLSRNPDAGIEMAAKKPEIDKTKMPLSGRDALAAIKAQSAKVTQRRKKKELQLR